MGSFQPIPKEQREGFMGDLRVSGLSPIEVLDVVDSTNEELMKRARAGAPHGTALRARRQAAGRGRRAHAWSSPEGGLYLSILVKPNLVDRVLPGIPVVCGIGVVSALEALGCEGIKLKWPNDVICARGKLGGILVELGRQSGEVLVVCGIGINVKAISAQQASPNALPVAGLADCLLDAASLPTLDELGARVRVSVLHEIDAWSKSVEASGDDAAPLTGIVDAYNGLLAYRGERVNVAAVDGEVLEHGVLRGVDVWGRALIELANGEVKAYDSSQVSLRCVR